MWSCKWLWKLTVTTTLLLSSASAYAQCEVANLAASDAAEEDQFGASVSISGNVAVIGAPRDGDAGLFSGSAYVYRRDGVSWIEEAKLTASDGAQGDKFGHAVAVSGDVALVGAYYTDNNGPIYGSGFGSAYVYRFDGNEWVEEAKLTASDAASGDRFGSSVAVSGDVAVIGAVGDDDQGNSSGSAYVFRFGGVDWIQEDKLTAYDCAAFDYFGGAVAVDGDVAVIGAKDGHFLSEDCGAAYLYRFSGITWIREARLEATDCDAQDQFGGSVSISGNVAVVGARNEGDTSPTTDNGYGAAYVFRYDGERWLPGERLVAFDAQAGAGYGCSVSVGDDLATIGARYHDNDGASGHGATYVYRFDGDGWGLLDKLAVSDGTLGDYFGDAVALSGVVAVIGMPNIHACRCVPGSAHVLALTHGCSSLLDYAGFQNCYSGSEGGVTPGCELFDVQWDNDVDLDDFSGFPFALTGP